MNTTLIKQKIKSGEIATFQELVKHVGPKALAALMQCSTEHVQTLNQGAGKVYLIDVINLSEALGVDKGKIMELWVE